jgi:hypothetical protein
MVVQGFELRAPTLARQALSLKPLASPVFVLVFFEIGSCELFSQVGFEP